MAASCECACAGGGGARAPGSRLCRRNRSRRHRRRLLRLRVGGLISFSFGTPPANRRTRFVCNRRGPLVDKKPPPPPTAPRPASPFGRWCLQTPPRCNFRSRPATRPTSLGRNGGETSAHARAHRVHTEAHRCVHTLVRLSRPAPPEAGQHAPGSSFMSITPPPPSWRRAAPPIGLWDPPPLQASVQGPVNATHWKYLNKRVLRVHPEWGELPTKGTGRGQSLLPKWSPHRVLPSGARGPSLQASV